MADYNFKPSMDVTAIARLMQQRAAQEQEQKNLEIERKYRAIKDPIQTGQSFAKDAVEASKRRQTREFAESAAAMFQTPGSTEVVGTGMEEQRVPVPGPVEEYAPKVPPVAGVPSIGVATPVAQTRQGPPQDNETSNLVRSAAMENPEAMSKLIAERAFGQKDAAKNQQMKLTKMDFRGSNGVRPVTVGVIGNQLVNPTTGQPFDANDPAAIDALPGPGYVSREYWQATGENGEPVYFNPTTQESISI